MHLIRVSAVDFLRGYVMAGVESDDCKRVRVPLNGENYYFSIGKDFISPTIPRENDPCMSEQRKLIEALCSGITKALGGE
jgi:hypothetical protein